LKISEITLPSIDCQQQKLLLGNFANKSHGTQADDKVCPVKAFQVAFAYISASEGGQASQIL
jgi:hypothetical protein